MTSQLDNLLSIAYHIVRGDYDLTIFLLTKCLTTLRAEVVMKMVEENSSWVAASSEDIVEIHFAATAKSSEYFRNQGRIPIFDQPLVVRCALGVVVPPETLSFVAMYNLALAYQLKYYHEEIQNVSNLRKAANLYKCSHDVVCSQRVKISAIHLFTLITNLASAEEAILGKEKGRLYLDRALSIYMFMKYGCVEKDLPESLCFFLWSVFPFLLPAPEVAPAA
ncbi:hypothetical protein IV203_032028 [Nitzschia inconspicua]|uniref:Uncharacterized protein n=1 Tax=Nitzschia inconspicua TaxID=303405 RepID=A0A9K3LWY7_9STRA|nr:hypothetical protein IV203_032028 [Nitzschia inconspicua]